MKLNSLLFLFVFIIGCSGVLTTNSDVEIEVKTGQVYSWEYSTPFKTSVHKVVILNVKKDEDGDWWVQYSTIYEKHGEIFYYTEGITLSARRQEHFLNNHKLVSESYDVYKSTR